MREGRLRVAYSIDARLGGGGIGNTAYNAVQGIYRAGNLDRLFVSSNAQSTIPGTLIEHWDIIGRGFKYLATKDPTGLVNYFETWLFDSWVAARMPRTNIFHGWNGMCLQSLRRAQALGAKTVVERASSHPATQIQLLREEYARWNVPIKLTTWGQARSLHEFAQADYITVPSSFAFASMRAAGVRESKLIQIPFGVDVRKFTPAPRLRSEPFRVIFAGQVSLRKGVPDLLQAWKHLAWKNSELWIVGGIASDWKAIRNRWCDVPGVTFRGHAQDTQSLYRQSDVFVFPSIEEGSALVTYEAMACGLPVITTENAGSVARDEQDGFIVPIRDPDAICKSLVYLRDHPDRHVEMGRSARERAEQFPWSRYQAELVANYKRIANDPIT
jgi:glycosyltransferase involved in cell wall biosynthesis